MTLFSATTAITEKKTNITVHNSLVIIYELVVMSFNNELRGESILIYLLNFLIIKIYSNVAIFVLF